MSDNKNLQQAYMNSTTRMGACQTAHNNFLKQCFAAESGMLVRTGALPPLESYSGARSSNGFAQLAQSYPNLQPPGSASSPRLRSPRTQYFRHRSDVTTPDSYRLGALASTGAARERIAFEQPGDMTPRAPTSGGILNDGSTTGMFSAGPIAPAWGESRSARGWDAMQRTPRHGVLTGGLPEVQVSPRGNGGTPRGMSMSLGGAPPQMLRGHKPTMREEDLLHASQRSNVFSAYMNASVRGGLEPR